MSDAENPGKIRPEEELIRLKKHFMAVDLNPGKIIWSEKDVLEGNASGLENFVSFGGNI